MHEKTIPLSPLFSFITEGCYFVGTAALDTQCFLCGTKGTDLQFGVYNDFLINNAAQQLPSVGQVTTVKILTGTDEPIWANQINVYPNPTTDKVFVDAQNIDIQSITIFDMLGKQIQNIQKSALTAPLSMPTAGTYFLKINTNKGVVMKKVVKM